MFLLLLQVHDLSISVWSDLPETTLRSSAKFAVVMQELPVDKTQTRNHGITRAYQSYPVHFSFYDLLDCAEHKNKLSVLGFFFPKIFLVQVVVWRLEPSFFSLLSRLYFVTASVRVSFRSWHSDYHH